MTLPWGVLGFYAALVVWIGMFIQSFRTGVWRTSILFGLGLTLFLNVRYLIEGVPAGAAFFIGIYDIIVNFGLSGTEQLKGLTTCPNNACTVWGDIYTQHSAWSASFYNRFANAPPNADGDAVRSYNLQHHHILAASRADVQTGRIVGLAQAHWPRYVCFPDHCFVLQRVAVFRVFVGTVVRRRLG